MKLATYLEIDGHTASSVALKCGVAVSTITRVARGEISPTPRLMQKLFDATDGAVTPNDLLGISTHPNDARAA